MKSDILTAREIRKFEEQINLPGIGIQGQEKFRKARILVIGAGGKGASALQALVAAGVGYIGICDNYPVEESALPRQSLYGEIDTGKLKAIVARQHLLEKTKLTEIELHNICLSEANIRPILGDYDIVLDATDNFMAHYLISDGTVATGKPLVFGSVYRTTAQVSVFNYAGGPSLRSLFPVVPHSNGEQDNAGIMGIQLLYAFTGNLMANESLKIILGSDTVLSGRVLHFNLKDYSSSVEIVKSNE